MKKKEVEIEGVTLEEKENHHIIEEEKEIQVRGWKNLDQEREEKRRMKIMLEGEEMSL